MSFLVITHYPSYCKHVSALVDGIAVSMLFIIWLSRLATSPSHILKINKICEFIDCMYPSDSNSTNYCVRGFSDGVIREVNYIDLLCI